jgi:hypothetical protein
VCGEVSDNLSRVLRGLVPRFANCSAEPKSSATSFIEILSTLQRRFFDLAEFLEKKHVWGRVVVCTRHWWGNLRERDHLKDPVVDGRIILRCIFRKWDVVVWTGSIWLRIGTGGGHL